MEDMFDDLLHKNMSALVNKNNDEMYKNLKDSLFMSESRFDAANVIGRGDIIDEVVRFIDSGEGCFVITGDAGTGKSAIAYELSKCEKVRAVHRCEVKKPRTRRACDVLRNLAYHLAVKDYDYAQALSREDLEALKTKDDENTLFDCLFRERFDGGESFALVIDGIDEMGTEEARKLLDLLCDEGSFLPNVVFILTLRSEARLKREWENFIELDKERNEFAAREMLTAELESRNIFSSERLEKILAASEGNFLYITLLLKGHDSKKYIIDEHTTYPHGLDGWYLRSMERDFPDLEKYSADYAPVLGVLCAAVSELSVEELAIFIGKEISETYALIEELGFAVSNENEKYSIFHRSMIDYLTTHTKSKKYYVKSADGDKAIIAAAKEIETEEIKSSNYLSRYLFCHIFRQKDSDFAQELYNLDDDEWVWECAAKSFQALSPREHADFRETVENMEHGMYLSWQIYDRLDRNRAVGAVINLGKCLQKSDKLKFDGFIFEGDGLFNSDKNSAAKAAYKEAAEIAEKDKTVSQSYENLRNLFVVYSKLGDIADRKNDIKDAKKYYSKSLEISEQNAVSFPSYGSRRDLSVSLNRMGDIADKEDNIQEAKKYYSEALEIARQNAEDFPSYESRRDLSVSLERMGDIAKKENNIQEAKEYYLKDVELCRQNAEDFPSYESRRDLSVSLNKMGDIAVKEDNAKEAKKYYSEMIEIDRQNAEDFPSYESRRDLSVSLNKMGNIAVKEDNAKEAKKYYSELLEIARQNAKDFPSYESRRDLSVSLNRMGNIADKEDDIQDAKKYYSEALEIKRQNAKDFPSYETFCDLAKSCAKNALAEKADGNYDKAKELFEEALIYAEKCFEIFPCQESAGLCEAIKNDLERLEFEKTIKSSSDDSEFTDFLEMLGSLDESELSELEGKIDELLKKLEELESDE